MVWKPKDTTAWRWILQGAGIFSISLFLATRLGPALLDPSFLLPMACLSMLFAGPMTVQQRSVAKAIPASAGIILASLGASLLWTGAGLPDPVLAAKAVAVSLAAASLTAALALLLIRKTSLRPSTVIWLLRALMLALYLLYRAKPEYFVV